MTPRSWEHWIAHFERRGYRVIAPAYPGFEVEVEALRADTTPIESVTVAGTLDHLEAVIAELDDPPILIGHSFGGELVQVLLDRGLGAAGIAINSVPTEGVRTRPASQIRATFPVLHNPANRHRAVGFTPKQFHYAFTNTLSEDESAAADERYVERFAVQLGLDVVRFTHHLDRHAAAQRIAEDVGGADLSGVSGIPTFFVNGRRHHGVYDSDTLSRAVRAAGARATLTDAVRTPPNATA